LKSVIPAGRAAVALLLIVLSANTGCPPKDEDPIRLRPEPRAYVRDVPVPEGFVLVDHLSEDQSTGTRRLYLRHRYEGRAEKFAIRSFYREQMPLAGWSLVSDGNVKGLYTLRFDKGEESCTIRISGPDRNMLGSVEIQVLILQEQRGSKAPGNPALPRQNNRTRLNTSNREAT
jgi:hypothetical protein